MFSLPCFLLCFLFFGSRLCMGHPSAVPAEHVELQPCPGSCVEVEQICHEVLNDTLCGDYICCLDEHFSTTDLLQQEVEPDVEQLHGDVAHEQEFSVYSNTEENSSPYDLNHQAFNMPPESRHEFNQQVELCPGACVPSHYAKFCDYVLPLQQICSEDSTCCVSEKDAARLERRSDFEETLFSFRRRMSQPSNTDKLTCPGTCVHPSYLQFCEKILPDYPCPINAKCCSVRTAPDKVYTNPNVQNCIGQCIPFHLHGYCFPPNEMITDTTCSRGTTCCMRRQILPQGPAIHKISFPVSHSVDRFASTDKNTATGTVLGYLASDDSGNIFKVSPDGQMSPLPKLTPQDRFNTFVNVAKFDRADGKVFIFADKNGFLYQKFAPFPQRDASKPISSDEVLAHVKQFQQAAYAHSQSGLKPVSTPSEQSKTHFSGNPFGSSDNTEDIVIPDDDDDAPIPSTMSSPLVKRKHSRPLCPGSCMSYFLRFTCFRGYAIYDGFSCGGRAVCCAKLTDIEEHEQFLKSLSPYFNAPPASRDPVLPRCGIKGRRDTPRVMGGKDSLAGKWCWQVAVINMENQYICGGALIDNSWVLTAAHCVSGLIRENQALYIRAGVTDLKSPEDNAAGQTVRVLSTFMHHNFKSMNLDNDIALLRLQKPLELGANVCVICLPTTGHMPSDDTKCTVTGYGFVSNEGTMSLKIREAKVPLVDEMDCMTNVTEALGNPFILPASTFCAGGHGQQDACQGDAGGPLACEVGGYYELVGLVSWSLGCGRNDVPSIYVKVPSFMGWINQIISSSSFLTSLN